jgi:hypothetical protein
MGAAFQGMHTLGAQAYDAVHNFFYVKSGTGSADGTPPPQRGVTVPITVQSIIDGKLVAESSVNHFLSGLDRSPSTANSTDMRLAPSYAGFGYQ